MTHPTLDEILSGSARAHLARCTSCQRLAALAGIQPPSPLTEDLDHLPVVDAAWYADWGELASGHGGMGQIFRARDRRLGRFVAIKQLRPGLEAGERAALIARFEREARLTARLQHPAIVGVHEAGRFADGEPFYAMPLLSGAPLGHQLAKRRDLGERLGLLPHLTTVAEAVAYAHDQGVVHRDIKPDNILIGTFGETVLLDWGLAKDLAADGDEDRSYAQLGRSDGAFTQLGVGTPQYMPPEQASGDEPDVRVDVYALGATLYHLLAGHPPYGDRDPAEVRRALAAGPPRPLADQVDAPRELIDIVERAMARAPAARFQRARDLADELRRFQTGQLLTSRRYTVGELARHFLRRYRVALRVIGVAAAVLIAVAIYAFVRIAGERDHARDSQLRAEHELRRAQGVIASQLAPDPARRLEALLLGIGAVAPDLAAEEVPVPEAYQGLIDALTAGPMLVPLPHSGSIKKFARSGDVLLGADDARSIVRWDARSGRSLGTLATRVPQPETIVVSPDARYAIVCGFDPIADLFDLATGTAHTLTARSHFAGCGFLPDGRLVLAADDVAVHDPATARALRRFELPAPVVGFAVSDRGHAVASLLDGSLWSWRPGQEPSLVPGPARAIWLWFSPDHRVLYHNGSDSTVRAWSTDDLAAPPVIVHRTSKQLGATTVSPDGRYVAVGMFDNDKTRAALVFDRTQAGSPIAIEGMSFWWWRDHWLFSDRFGPIDLVDVETRGVVLTLAAHTDEAALDIVGDRLASRSRDGPAFLWDITPGPATGLLLGHTAEVVAVLPRGPELATASRDGTLRIWRDGAAEHVMRSPVELSAATWLERGLVVGDLEGTVRFVDEHGQERARAEVAGAVSALSASADRVLIGTLGGALEIRDSRLGAPVVLRSDAPVTAAALAPDGARAVSSHGDGTLRLWDARTGALLGRLPDPQPLEDASHEGDAAVAFSTDRKWILASRPSGGLRVLDAGDLATHALLEGRQLAHAGDQIACALPDGGIVLHELGTSRSSRLLGHRKPVLAASFSPDRTRLATASIDGSVRIWELATGQTSVVLASGGLGPATAITFLEGGWLVIGYASGAVRLQPATPLAALQRACTVAARFGRGDEVASHCSVVTESARR